VNTNEARYSKLPLWNISILELEAVHAVQIGSADQEIARGAVVTVRLRGCRSYENQFCVLHSMLLTCVKWCLMLPFKLNN
jgi:hypothetical protein